MPGRTSGNTWAEVRARVEGIVAQLTFTEGTEVKAGDLLYHLDDRTLESQVQSAQAALDRSKAEHHLAQQTLKRVKTLLSTRAVSQQELDEAEAQLKKTRAEISAAKAALRRTQINLKYAHITAPIAGRALLSHG